MDNISLKGLIKILLKNKFKILITTIVFLFVGVFYALLFPKKYKASASLQIKPINMDKTTETDNLTRLIDSMNNFSPSSNIATYKELLNSSTIMSKTIENLNLDISVRSLQSMVSIEVISNTDLIRISVSNTNPKLAADIANTISSVFIEYISEKNKESANNIALTIGESLVNEAKKLDQESKKLRDYTANSGSIQLMSEETSSLVIQITELRTLLYNTQKEILIIQNSLQEITQNKNDSFNKNMLQNTMLSVEVTNLEIKLITCLETEKALTTQIANLESTLSELQAKLADEKYKYESIVREYDLAEQAYGAYQSKYKEAIIASASDIGRATLQISSSAIIPSSPEGIGNISIIAIAVVLGLIISISGVLFIEYLKTAGVSYA